MFNCRIESKILVMQLSLCIFFLMSPCVGKTHQKVASQIPLDNQNAVRTVVSGQITGYADNADVKVTAVIFDSANMLYSAKIPLETTIKGGEFKFELNLKNPVGISLYIDGKGIRRLGIEYVGMYELFEPGDSINMDFSNGLEYNSIKFTGKGSEKFDCIRAIEKDIVLEWPDESPETSLSNAKKALEMGFHTIDLFKNRLPTGTRDLLKADLLSRIEWAALRSVMQQPTASDSIKRAFQEWAGNISGVNDSLVTTAPIYAHYLMRRAIYTRMNEQNLVYEDSNAEPYRLNDNEIYDAISKVYRGSVQDWILARYLIDYRKNLDEARVICIKRYLKRNQRSPFYRQIEYFYNEYKNRLAEGSPAYAFSLRDTTGQVVSLSQFSGQVLLIDFYFNGCGGCYSLVPILKQIEEHYNGKAIKFVSISIDKTISIWKDGIGTYSVPGSVQLYTNGTADRHPVINFYNIYAYPTLVLIDKDGKIVTSRAPDPRDDNGKALMKIIDDKLRL
ncbi:MAG: TlpA family protein disulfide reductase [Chitinophagaceae bacterium]|nr:MAG: TlpA family protein disulfide reductase [Chitinophagaceae bacterium]